MTSIKDLFTRTNGTAQAPVEVNYGAAAVLASIIPDENGGRPVTRLSLPETDSRGPGKTVRRGTKKDRRPCVDCGKVVTPKWVWEGSAVVCSDCITLREIKRGEEALREALNGPPGSVAALFAQPTTSNGAALYPTLVVEQSRPRVILTRSKTDSSRLILRPFGGADTEVLAWNTDPEHLRAYAADYGWEIMYEDLSIGPDPDELILRGQLKFILANKPLSWVLSCIEEALPIIPKELKDATFRRAKPNVPGKVKRQGKRGGKGAK